MNKENKRRVLWLGALVLLVGGIILLIRQRDNHQATETIVLQPLLVASNQVQKTSRPNGAVPKANATIEPVAGRLEKVEAAIRNKNVTVNFWGRVVDQDDVPLPGVKVKLYVRKWVIAGPGFSTDFPAAELMTDSQGNFQLLGEQGDTLTIEVLQKDGYEPEPLALRTFGYNVSTNINPDPQNPIILRMWKADRKESLVTGDKRFSTIPDGRVYTVNLEKGSCRASKDKEGDFWFSVTRPVETTFGQRYEWSYRIEPIDGGILEEKDPMASMFIAPEQGYVKAHEFSKPMDKQGWSPLSRKRFFLHTQNRYARVDIFVSASSGNIHVQYALNPAGSRILR